MTVDACILPATTTDRSSIGQAIVTIDILPDDVLLEIFTVYLGTDIQVEKWHGLIHVCRRWRHIVFASPRRLDLQLVCTPRRRVKEMLDVWPALPLVIRCDLSVWTWVKADNVIAALKHNDRVCQILWDYFSISSSLLEGIVAVMQEPFQVLTDLRIIAWDKLEETVFPEEFLGGSAPRLRSCDLWGIAYPGIWKLLLNANHLVNLSLWNIPHSGYISPEAMVMCLSATPNLENLSLGFRSPRSRPGQADRSPPPPTRIVLPALTCFRFKGVSEYLEDLVSRIGIPLLDNAEITFFHQLIFDTPRLHEFLARAEAFKAPSRANVAFSKDIVCFDLESRLSLRVTCTKLDCQLSSMAQLCSLSLPRISTLERLDIREGNMPRPYWQDDVESPRWLEFLRPFTALRDLYLDKKIAPRVVIALKELIGGPGAVTEELPALQRLVVEELPTSGPVQEVIGQFVAVRQLSGRPVAIHSWVGRS